MAHAISDDMDGLDRLKVDIGYFLPDVLDEIAELDRMFAANPQAHRERALLFSLASPQNKFDNNVIAGRRLHQGLHSFATLEDVYQALAADKMGTVTSGSTARSIYNSLPLLRDLPPYTGDDLRQWQRQRTLFGAGPKVSAFAAHLVNAYDDVFTLDTHMTRGIVDTILGIQGTWTLGDSAYRILEDAVIRWSYATYPDLPLFAVQWAMWSVFRGSFDSHVAIFT
jgi:hypothetical protein